MKIQSTAVLAAATLSLAACQSDAADAEAPASPTAPGGSVTVLVHDSFALPDDLVAAFEAESGIDVTFQALGDAGTLVNQLSLTAGTPLGDAVYGIDNTFASRAIDSGALADYTSAGATDTLDGALTAIDYSDVCFNVDLAAYPEGTGPATLADLTDPAYAGQVSVPNPTTSSPGLALLLATYATYGDGWADYWRQLRDNDLQVTASWSDTYFVDFSAPNYGGDYPIVLSYASSPPSEVIDAEATTRALLDTCFRQVEYAGLLEGAENPEGAKVVIDWMLSDAVQSALPGSMYVYPVSDTATIPGDWLAYAPLSPAPITMSPDEIDAVRDDLLREWSGIVIDGE